MTMFPAHLSSKCVDNNNNINGGFSQGGYDCFISLGRGLVSDLMAEDESRTEESMNNEEEEEEEEEEEGSSSKDINMNVDVDDDHGHWLQLSLGGGHTGSTTSNRSQMELTEKMEKFHPSVTLDLLTGGGSASSPSRQKRQSPPPPPQLIFQVPEFQGHSSFLLQPQQTAAAMNFVPFMTLQQQQQQHQQQQQEQYETNYNYMHLIRPLNPPVSSSSSFSGSSEQHGRSINVHRRLNVARVVNPPRRPHSGVWFVLQASQNQLKEPFLPQIPKSYMRIKDGRMTIGLLIKYLVDKLDLGSESEVEITCKGHQLLSLLTLQHVRDTIWNSPRNDVGFSVAPRSSATMNHLMVLNYGRIA
ncbi:uncharacterized protein LOC143626075 [Bidens hawaiensis]|uniref:uncharacterized protein LOC143626075 n=1 Tax=Bidens hawaiensis TaxID=980011 RepID=UPI00404A258B